MPIPAALFRGRIGNIGPILDPNIRTAKVRIEIENPGPDAARHVRHRHVPRGAESPAHATVPAAAILHLHDRDWVYMPIDGTTGEFRRVEVVAGKMLPPNLQEIVSGIHAGERVVSNALVLQNTAEQ